MITYLAPVIATLLIFLKFHFAVCYKIRKIRKIWIYVNPIHFRLIKK